MSSNSNSNSVDQSSSWSVARHYETKEVNKKTGLNGETRLMSMVQSALFNTNKLQHFDNAIRMIQAPGADVLATDDDGRSALDEIFSSRDNMDIPLSLFRAMSKASSFVVDAGILNKMLNKIEDKSKSFIQGDKEAAPLFLQILVGNPTIQPNSKNSKGTSLIRFAYNINDSISVTCLAKRGADVNARYSSQRFKNETLLMMAARAKRHEMVKGLLVGEKVEANAIESRGNTALMIACFHNAVKVVQELVKHFPVVRDMDTLRNRAGETATEIATQNDHQEIIAALKDGRLMMDALVGLNSLDGILLEPLIQLIADYAVAPNARPKTGS